MTSGRFFDVVVVGGGFSSLAIVANIVRLANAPLSIAIISRDGPETFGPAYSTPHAEHLLNVRAAAMGLFDDRREGFHEWAAAKSAVSPGDYLPRPVYSQYLRSVLDETRTSAVQKKIDLHFVRAEVKDITEAGATLRVISDPAGDITAQRIVLALGNSFRKNDTADVTGFIEDPWAFNYQELPLEANIAIIGSGLTAADTIISILGTKWQGQMTCLSGNAALPQAHPADYDAKKIVALDGRRFLSKRLSEIMRVLRAEAKLRGAEWPYVIDSLRPMTQEIWKSLSVTDQKRLIEKYFTLWNSHRHRYAAPIGAKIREAVRAQKLVLERARCCGIRQEDGRVRLDLQARNGRHYAATFDLVFKCTGMNYRVNNNPLLKKLLERGMLKPTANTYGIAVSGDYIGYAGPGSTIYVTGAPLLGTLFETTAVPELRQQAAVIAKALC